MDLMESFVIFASIAVLAYWYAKKKRVEQEELSPNINQASQSNQQITMLKEELERRAKIIHRVEDFIKSSKFVEPIAEWRNDKIYKYVFNNGYLYEFDEILPENNQRIGIDEDFLCFKRFSYKRVNNPVEFMEKFGKSLLG